MKMDIEGDEFPVFEATLRGSFGQDRSRCDGNTSRTWNPLSRVSG